jgi:hypothetical protein
MAFRDNSVLIGDAGTIAVVADGDADIYTGTTGADAFVIADGNVGDDTLEDFNSNDSLITGKRIFDGNNDGFISFGPNGTLDVDRTSSRNAGNDNLQIVGPGGKIDTVRYLGEKGGQHVYADATTRLALIDAVGEDVTVFEGTGTRSTQGLLGTVANNAYDASAGASAFLFDNALGLNLGSDTMTGFGDDDALVFTSELFNKNGNVDDQGRDIITFGSNQVLDVSGSSGPEASDPSTGPGGQIDFGGTPTSLVLLGTSEGPNGQTYYYYGTAGSTFDVPGDA